MGRPHAPERLQASHRTTPPTHAYLADWCGCCIKIEKDVFSTKKFQDFAAANVVRFEAAFPKKKPVPAELKAQNAILKKEYLAGGYPTVYLLDSEGKKLSDDLGEIKGGVQVFITKLTKLVAKSKNP